MDILARDKIMEKVMIQLEIDSYAEDYTSIEQLLEGVSNRQLLDFLTEETVNKLKEKD